MFTAMSENATAARQMLMPQVRHLPAAYARQRRRRAAAMSRRHFRHVRFSSPLPMRADDAGLHKHRRRRPAAAFSAMPAASRHAVARQPLLQRRLQPAT